MPEAKLTSAAIQNLIDQLNEDLQNAMASSKIDALAKGRIAHGITGLITDLEVARGTAEVTSDLGIAHGITEVTNALGVAKMDPSQPDVSGWAPAFAALTTDLQAALGLAATQVGCCYYPGGCAVMTQQQCTALSGDFKAGKLCPPSS
jgi:hypothetical protein